jgi:hypothetical protein|mmetsp:Transcript_11670/g.15834  ORF Transcript_11670/g.15834 Transcript_11670/m.15834 type:complete len:102 (+) Transcript_11670:465-770(+)|eukprot:CAMPEP_0170452014 /NCGR_PEP_ID=MMETSP0123-20130129/1065_1 /TAXON_ID=182087 /ORGANISM="Favella ehrenbergii, Strain Fehren 1" /LENGTH=101 /DNA_ID=CAMNT_0010713901 /DNA_START=472 /DNA_END=777 /DNA_ORIENTATION=-
MLGLKLKNRFLDKFHEKQVLDNHSRTSSVLSSASARAQSTMQKADEEVVACRQLQSKFFKVRRNIHLIAYNQAKMNKIKMDLECLDSDEEREAYFSGRHAA